MKLVIITCLLLTPLIAQQQVQETTPVNGQLLDGIQELLKSSYSQYTINVHIYDGVVTLVGRVNSEADKKSIEEHISQMAGVRKVYNHLHVKDSHENR